MTVNVDPVTGLPTLPGGGGVAAPPDPNIELIEQWTRGTKGSVDFIIDNFGTLVDQSSNLYAVRSNTAAILIHLQSAIALPVATVTRLAHSCSGYDLSVSASLNIPASPTRKSLRIINASGNGATYPASNQSDILVGTTVVPTAQTFDRHIVPLGSELMDFPALEHYVGAIGGATLDGFFIVVEGF
jgi:hypothetical protein